MQDIITENAIACESVEALKKNVWFIAKKLETDGFCVIDAWDSEIDTLKELASYFGNRQSLIRANEDGIVDVTPGAAIRPSGDQSEYIGTSTSQFNPHTDGSYLNGFLRVEGKLYRIGPPKLILLQCVTQASQGGTSIIVDTEKVLRDLLFMERWHAKVLMTRGSVSFCRDDQLAMDFPVFERTSKHLARVRFRYDSMMYTQHWSSVSVQMLQSDYLVNPRYSTRLKLREGQILILDNYRVLHGRDGIEDAPSHDGGSRLLRRIWIQGDDHTIFANAVSQNPEHTAFGAFEPYRFLPGTMRNGSPVLGMKCGIHLSPDMQMTMDGLLEEDYFA